MGLDPTLYHVEALLTTTAETLERWKEVVDTYVALGCRALFLRPPILYPAKRGRRPFKPSYFDLRTTARQRSKSSSKDSAYSSLERGPLPPKPAVGVPFP